MKYYTFLFAFFLFTKIFAQSWTIDGFILDSFTRERIDSVTVRFLSVDSTECASFIGKRFGMWDFTGYMDQGDYIIHFSKEGYEDAYKNLSVRYKKHRIVNNSFGEVLMRKKQSLTSRQLGEAVVTATRIKMVMKGDTIVYNADAFQLHEGSMLDRLIMMLPGFQLKQGGELFVNGKKVQSLLVNGEDFFRGNPRVALENLPAYMVDKVKVYEKGPDRERLIGMTPDEYRGVNNPLVVDVNLKRQYSIGWIANATVGGGTDNHYSARAFALRFTPQSRLAFMGYSNNVYGNSYYDTNGNWQSPGGSANMKTHELTSDLLVNDKRKRYKINNTATFKMVKQTDDELQSSISYLGESNIYGMKSNHNISRNWFIRDNATMTFTPSLKSTFVFQPEAYYNKYSNMSLSLSADFDRQLAEQYMGEALDSLFFDGSSTLYRKNLISSLMQNQKNEGHYMYAKGSLAGSMRILQADYLRFSVGGSYDHAENRNLFDAVTADGADRQDRFTHNPNWGYSYNANVGYRYHLKFQPLNLAIEPEYGFSETFRSSDRSYYQLEDTEWAEGGIDRLTSARNDLLDYMDASNTVFSDSWKRTHRAAANIEILFKNKNYRKNRILTFSVPLRIATNKLDYQRGEIDTLFHNTYTFFEPEVQYRYDYNNGTSLEQHFNMRYSLTSSEPSSDYLTGYRDSSTPLIVRIGNKSLKNTKKHEAEANYSRNVYKGKKSYFSIGGKYTLWENQLCQSMTYDTATGLRTYRPDNINGNWGIHSQLLWRSTFDKEERINYTTETNFDYRHSADYAELEQAAGSARTSVNRFVTRQHFNVYYAHNYYSLSANFNVEWTHSTSNRFKGLDAFNISYGLSGGLPLPFKFHINTNVNLYSRYGYSNDKYNTNQLIWSARLSRSFLHGLMNAELEAFDILNKMSSYSYAINAQMQTETYRNVLRRYVMLNLTFRLNKEPKKR